MPMPRILKIMPQFWVDCRLRNLATALGSYDVAVGKAVQWLSMACDHYAAEEIVPEKKFKYLDCPELETVGLAVRIPGGFRAAGDHEHFSWLLQKQNSGRSGGLAKAENLRKRNHEPSYATADSSCVTDSASYAIAKASLNEERRTKNIINPPTPQGGLTPEDLKRIWNENRGSLPECKALNKSRTRSASARLAEESNPDIWAACVQAIANSPFHAGHNERQWRADFDYLLRTKTMLRFKEGAYVRRASVAESIELESF